MQDSRVLVINPGSTSTKLACFIDGIMTAEANVQHDATILARFADINDQFTMRLEAVEQFVSELRLETKLSAVVGRGGLLRPTTGGTFVVNDAMVEDLKLGRQGQHASNLGGLLARAIADPLGIPCFVVDPVAVDEFEPIARLSGHPLIERRSLSHALSMKAVARRAAKELDIPYLDSRFVVAHLGGGISVAPMLRGRVIDVNNANEMGPFSPERTGGLPSGDLAAWCFSGQLTAKEMQKQLQGQGGMVAYLGTTDAREAYRRADSGDKLAADVMQAMAYQIAKEIGAMSTVLAGRVDAVVLTGGLAHSDRLCETILGFVSFIAPMLVYRGDDEMLALAEGVWRVQSGTEELCVY